VNTENQAADIFIKSPAVNIIKGNVTYYYFFLLELPYHTTEWTTAKLCFTISVQDFAHTWMLQIFRDQNGNCKGLGVEFKNDLMGKLSTR
jgi:hypothetical protein